MVSVLRRKAVDSPAPFDELPEGKPNKPGRPPYSELVFIFCKITHRVIDKYVPFDELQANIPHNCRHTPDIAAIRLRGFIFGTGLAAVIGLVVGFILTQIFLLPVAPVSLGVVSVSGFMGLLCWWVSPHLFGFPYWTVRREWDVTELEKGNDVPIILPLDYTYCRGITSDLWDAETDLRRRAAMEARERANSDGSAASLSDYGIISADAEDDGYLPLVNRGHMIFEIMLARNAVERLKGKGRNRMAKMQIASSIGLAAMIVLLVFFYIVMTMGE